MTREKLQQVITQQIFTFPLEFLTTLCILQLKPAWRLDRMVQG